MEKLNGGKAYLSLINLNGYPQAREQLPVLFGIIHTDWILDEKSINVAEYKKCVVLETFINTKNQRVIQVIPKALATAHDVANAVHAVDNYLYRLHEQTPGTINPRSKYKLSDDENPDSFTW